MSLLTSALEARLLACVRARAGDAALTWFDAACAQVATGPTALLDGYAAAGLRLGRAALDPAPADLEALAALAPSVGFAQWTLADAGRMLLLATRRAAAPDTFVADALACYEQGDAREQQSWLRALSLWPEADAFQAAAIDACRTSIVPLFEAIACENPYPARFFPELNFNQMVLKALFNAIALDRIVGLAARRNAEMSRMARDYAAERRAAGRSVPADIGQAMLDAPQQEQLR